MTAGPDREMLIELVDLHARALLRMPWVELLLVIGLGLFVYPYVGAPAFLAWGSVTVGVEVLRASYSSSVLRRGYDVDPKRTHTIYVLFAAIAGGAIGGGAVLFLPRLPILHQALFGAVLFAIPAAGVAVSQSSRYIIAAYALSILLPSSITWGFLHPSQAWGLAALTLLFCSVLILVATDGDKLLLRSVMIRHERDRLVRDLEQRNADVQAAMAQAEQSAQARARVLAAASHDLRQPLHALSVYSAVLAANPSPGALRELSGNIDIIVRSLGDLLNGLLDLSRLSAGYYVPERRNVALDRLVRDVCAELQPSAVHKRLDLVTELTPVFLLGDPVAIGRIARNLIDNAIKYTDRGAVTVTTACEMVDGRPMAVLSVLDTGKGIPASDQTRIFEEFYQLENPGRDRSKGVGLGLAIVQRLCELIGAAVTVSSELGRGTCFRITMPGGAAASLMPETNPSPVTHLALAGRRVYVVDDEVDILRSMRVLLNLWGVETLTADSPQMADAVFAEHGPPDLMIVDLRLRGEEHGAQLAERMEQAYGAFPVLIITGETSSEALRRANERGYTLLQKPIAPEVLRDAMVTVMANVAMPDPVEVM